MKPEDLPALYRSANKLSDDSQRRFLRALRIQLAMLVLAATLSAINYPVWWAAALQALMLVLAMGSAVYLTTQRPQQTWYGARAAAESVKTTSWRYACRAEPFDKSGDESREEFTRRMRAIVEQNMAITARLTTHLTAPHITERMAEIRSLAIETRKRVYVTERIDDQLDWYSNKATEAHRNSTLFFWSIIAANIATIACSLLRIRFPMTQYWPTDIFLAASACLVSWTQARRFSDLSSSYALAAHEIGILRAGAMRVQTSTELSKFIGDAENAFSREHTQWIARKDDA